MRRPVGRLGSGLLVLLVPEISNRRGRERKDSARCSACLGKCCGKQFIQREKRVFLLKTTVEIGLKS